MHILNCLFLPGEDYSWLIRILKEVHVLETLKHPNIIVYKHAWIEYHKVANFGPQVPCLFVLMEYANGGNLEEYVKSEIIDSFPLTPPNSPIPSFLPENELLGLFLAIARGLAHLHHLGIIHRDLKPSNLLLNFDRDKITRPNVLITDFGECTNTWINLQSEERTGATGTIEFVAPELFQKDLLTGKLTQGHSEKTDMWSLGMILYFLYFNRLPYTNTEDIDILISELSDIWSIKVPRDQRPINPKMVVLLESLLERDPDMRPSADTIVSQIEHIIKDESMDNGAVHKKARRMPSLLPRTRSVVISPQLIQRLQAFINLEITYGFVVNLTFSIQLRNGR